MMNKKKEVKKKQYSVKLLESVYLEVISFWGWKFWAGIENIVSIILEKNKKEIPNTQIGNTFLNEKEIPNWNIKMNDKMQQFLGNKIDTVVVQEEEKKQPTAFQQIKISEINRLTSNWMKSHREDWEEFTKKDLMTRAGLLDFF